jgi:hypothetical protein
MSNLLGGSASRQTVLGTRVANAAAGKTLAATGTGTIFTVAGGKVAVTSIVGEVTTVIQTQANNIKLVATPTTGSVNDLTGVVESSAAAVGSLFSAQGLAADALVKSTGGGVSTLRQPIIVAIGTIGLNTAATNTGAIKWTLTYVPIDDGATVTAA